MFSFFVFLLLFLPENFDSIYVEITHNNKKLILATVYRPPKLQAVDDTALYNEIQSLIQGKNAIIINDAFADRGSKG